LKPIRKCALSSNFLLYHLKIIFFISAMMMMKSLPSLIFISANIFTSTVSAYVSAAGPLPGTPHLHMAKGVHFIMGSHRNWDCSPSFDSGRPLMLNADCRQNSPRAMLGIQKGWLRTRPNGGLCAKVHENIVYWEHCDRGQNYPSFHMRGGSTLAIGDKCMTTNKEGIAVMGSCTN
jgi:hypothetical protein